MAAGCLHVPRRSSCTTRVADSESIGNSATSNALLNSAIHARAMHIVENGGVVLMRNGEKVIVNRVEYLRHERAIVVVKKIIMGVEVSAHDIASLKKVDLQNYRFFE